MNTTEELREVRVSGCEIEGQRKKIQTTTPMSREKFYVVEHIKRAHNGIGGVRIRRPRKDKAREIRRRRGHENRDESWNRFN
ncbi:hypothetical protein NECAME_09958 [Necator americanus]|uniref:Uncharacterized protein n=1 Tax=Necator americanus TaxID=51031 RepID=W2TBG5_NECAM|nr:hypothetical protein NECAME_09958 [Necator americanus]ETN79193.1 hypothetical protein NECAME_09958 [Necator americanus]